MAFRVHLRMGLEDLSVRTDHVRDPLGRVRRRRIARAVRHADLAFHVAEEREREGELPGKGGVLLDGVERDAPDLGVLLLEFRVEVAEPATFEGSTGSIGLRIEPEDDRFPFLAGQPNGVSAMVPDLEVRRRVSDGKHDGLPFLSQGFFDGPPREADHRSEFHARIAGRTSSG